MLQQLEALENTSNVVINDDEDLSTSFDNTNMTVGEQIKELTKRFNLVNEKLLQQVRDNHGALLQQATHAGRFDKALEMLANDVQHIRSVGYRMQQQIDVQYQLIANQVKVLSRLHDLSHLFRSAKTLLTLTAKLKTTKDVLKQAELHYELNELVDDADLKQITFVQSACAYVINSRQKIRNLTQMQLINGLQEKNETQVVNALKVFVNFNTLEKCLNNVITTFITNLEQSLKECFAGKDISVLDKTDTTKTLGNQSNSLTSLNIKGPGKAPQLTTTQNFRAKFWKSLHWLIYDELYEYCSQVLFLKKVLEQVQQFGYIIPNAEQSIQTQFWSSVQKLFSKYLDEAAPHITQTLQDGLSKLLSSIRGLEQRLNREFLFDSNLFTSMEQGYNNKCMANMKACLAGIDLPNEETIDNYIRTASLELSCALVDKRLGHMIADVFIKTSQELCANLESQIKLGADSVQVVDVANVPQIQNTLLANTLFYLKDSTKRMMRDLAEQFQHSQALVAQENIIKSLERIDLLIQTILQQIMDSIFSTINIIILSIHREPGLKSEKLSATGTSMYMKELQEFVNRVWHNHLAAFEDKELVQKCCHEVAKRSIEFFVYNLSILRPITASGRQRLQNDCLFMEHALKPLCANISELGNSARLLRAMSLLILQSPHELIKQHAGNDTLVSASIILLLLFGHAGKELESPHTTVNWSNERFIEWLESHTNEREKLELIAGALQRYRDGVRRKKSEQYDPVYPLIMQFLETTFKELSKEQ